MAEGAVTFILNKLSELVQKEELMLKNVKEEVEFIMDELTFMKSFLRAADAMEDRDHGVKVLVDKVRDVAYEVEDVLDEFVLRQSHDPWGGCCYPFNKACLFIRNVKTRHEIASRIVGLKSRATKIAEAHRRYLLRNNIMAQGYSSKGAARISWQGEASFIEEADLVGIEQPRKQLTGWLLGGEAERQVVSVVGMGGLGKTTLVKKVFDDPDVKMHFKFRAWITVSQSFKIEDLLRDTIQQLFYVIRKPQDAEGMESMSSYELRQIINKFLQKRRYLIVLDDVWHTRDWDAFRQALPDEDCGSRVLLTTRNAHVAQEHSFPGKVYSLNPLSKEESWTLFCKRVFQQGTCPMNLQDVCESILLRCEGLPLAIVAIGGLLATKDKSRVDDWEMVHRSLDVFLEDGLQPIRKILSLSYNDLPYYLKSSLLYFSMFPKGYPIGRMRLVRLWVAEGFVKERENKTLEEVAEEYLNELISRSLVQVVEATSDGRVKTCRIHDLLREIMVLKSRDQGFAAIVSDASSVFPEKVRRVSIHNVKPSLQKTRSVTRLRSALMFWGVDSSPQFPTLNPLYHHVKLLNVLDLEGAPLSEFPHQAVSLLLLKYLSLRKTKVNSIPSTIGKLQTLETLDLKQTQVPELPVEILKLQKLRHLLVYRYERESEDQIFITHGFKAPCQVGELKCILKLCFMEANSSLVAEIGRLTQLRRLGLVKLRTVDGKALCSSIKKLTNLLALSLTSIKMGESIDLEHLSSPPPFLRRLYLTGRLVKLPNWLRSATSLVKVVLTCSKLTHDPLRPFQNLPNLVHLEFIQAYEGAILCFEAYGFGRLKCLVLTKLSGLKTITLGNEAMPLLEKLIIQSCKFLQNLPTGIERLRKLKVLNFFDMPEEFIKTLHPNGEDGDYKKIEHVPDVYFTYWNNGNWDIFSLDIFRGNNHMNIAQPSRYAFQ